MWVLRHLALIVLSTGSTNDQILVTEIAAFLSPQNRFLFDNQNTHTQKKAKITIQFIGKTKTIHKKNNNKYI